MVPTEQSTPVVQVRHAELIAKLEGAAEGSRELDCLIREWDDPRYTPDRRVTYYGEPTGEHVSEEGEWSQSPIFTTSIDAALGLIERKLPGHQVKLHIEPNRTYASAFWVETKTVGRGEAPTAAIALCIALLKALSDGPKGHGTAPQSNGPTNDQ